MLGDCMEIRNRKLERLSRPIKIVLRKGGLQLRRGTKYLGDSSVMRCEMRFRDYKCSINVNLNVNEHDEYIKLFYKVLTPGEEAEEGGYAVANNLFRGLEGEIKEFARKLNNDLKEYLIKK